MGLFDSLFGKGELELLRAQLARETSRVDQALQELRLVQEKAAGSDGAFNALEVMNGKLLAEVKDLNAERNDLLVKVDSLESEIIQAWELGSTIKAQNQKFGDELHHTRESLALLHKELETNKKVASELSADNLRLNRLNKEFLSKQSHLEQQFFDRETKLQAKSEKLQVQNTELVNLQSALLAQEKNWKVAVEPKLRVFEAYCSLEERADQVKRLEAGLAAKAAVLNEQEVTLEQLGVNASKLAAQEKMLNERAEGLSHLQSKLDDERAGLAQSSRLIEQQREQVIARELSVAKFKKRIDQIIEEEAALKKRQESLDRKESRNQREFEKKREEIEEEHASLRDLKAEFKRREDAVSAREREFSRLSEQLQAYVHSNTTLRAQLSATKSSLEDCLRSQSRMNSPPSLRIGDQTKKNTIEDDHTPLPPLSKPSLALRSNSPLTGAGYHVGISGIGDENERRELLELFIATPLARLPKVGDSEYMKLWGEANTRMRIRYVAYHIFWNIEFQGARETMDLARDHWLLDLKWLKRTYSGKLPANHWPDIPKI